MALLTQTHASLLLASAVTFISCVEPSDEVTVELRLYDEPVTCDATAGECRAPGGAAVSFEDHRVRGYLSRAASQYGEGGIYLHFQLPRPNGTVAVVELDVPAGVGAGATAKAPLLVYREYRAGKRAFDGASVWGVVEVPMDAACACQDGRLELVFRGLGLDGKPGTADDPQRRLSLGRFGAAGACRQVRLRGVQRADGVLVDGLYGCPGSHHGGGPSGGGEGTYEEDLYYTGCEPPPDEEWEEGGCEGDTSDDGWDDAGCEGDTGDDDWDTEGCGGDSGGGGDFDTGGCEGDSGGGEGLSCEGDAYAAAPGGRARPGPLRSRDLGFLMPVSLALMITFLRRRRRLR